MTEVTTPPAGSMSTVVCPFPDQITVVEPDCCGLGADCTNLNSSRPPNHQRALSEQTYAAKNRLSFASLAKGTHNALANLSHLGTNHSNPSLRHISSSDSIAAETFSPVLVRPPVIRAETSPGFRTPLEQRRKSGLLSASMDSPPDMGAERTHNRMQQTSSKILRMTDNDRPFNRDFQDLFATLVTSLPLTPHRVRFSRVEETFSSEEAITNLGSLKFSQSNRIPDPKNSQRWVVTTTTTTFSMTKEMARTVCQQFVDARFIESAESKSNTIFTLKSAVWQLTPKGVAIMQRFCSRNGIVARHIEPLLRLEQMQLVVLERDPETDKFVPEKGTIEIIFRRFIGAEGPNLKNSTTISDSDSLSEYSTGLVGVKMARERRVGEKIVANTFTGKAASDWLLDCSTTVDRKETDELAELFIKWQLVSPVQEDKQYVRYNPLSSRFQPTKYAIYTVTERGQRLVGMMGRPPSMSSEDSQEPKERPRGPKDSNVTRLNVILKDPALRFLFKEFLRLSLCEENLSFYLDVSDFTRSYRQLEESGKLDKPEAVRETLAAAFGLYNSFLASGAPSELNIDHSLRSKLDNRMIRTDNNEQSMAESLSEVVNLFELAQSTVFKLMASDSVPKFINDPRNAAILRDHEIDVSSSNRSFAEST